MGAGTVKTVLFTPGGSGMAITAIKALSAHEDVRTIATDIDDLAPGLHLADVGYLVPPFDDDGYMDAVRDIVDEEDVDVVVPCLDPILERFAAGRSALEGQGCELMAPPLSTLTITQDKWRTYTELSSAVPLPDSWLDATEVQGEIDHFLKPRRGSGSKDAHHVTSREELEFYSNRIEDPIIQTYLPGREYTVDCLTDDDGDLLAAVPRHRIEVTGGISTKVEAVDNIDLFDIAETIASRLEFVGPFFVQAKEDRDGKPRVTEIGARIAGTMCHDLVEPSLQYLAVSQLCGETVSEPEVAYGRRLSRYWCELQVDGKPDNIERW